MSYSNPVVVLRNAGTRVARNLQVAILRRLWGMTIGKGAAISLSAKLDLSNPKGITIGEYSSVCFGSVILTHDYLNNKHLDTRIGRYCYIGARAIIMPGVTVGDHSIVAISSVVMKDVPPNSVVSGNPARVVETGIMTGPYGMRLEAVPQKELVKFSRSEEIAAAKSALEPAPSNRSARD